MQSADTEPFNSRPFSIKSSLIAWSSLIQLLLQLKNPYTLQQEIYVTLSNIYWQQQCNETYDYRTSMIPNNIDKQQHLTIFPYKKGQQILLLKSTTTMQIIILETVLLRR